ncbi:PepSY-associated TM helix domain-containing protein [Methylomonas sp. MgM2]
MTRTVWLRIHLYLALVFGLLFALMGLTGSLNLYREEIDALLNPDLIVEQNQGQPLPLDKILAQVRKAHPNRHGAWTLEMPRSPNGVITAWFDNPQESVGKFYAPLMVAINPYTGHVISSRFWGETLTTWLLDLHTHLQLNAEGRDLVAILAVLLFISVASGLYLWWPGLANPANAFQIRHKSGLMRFIMDLHRLIGLFSAGFLLLLAFTGFHLAYPKLLENLTSAQDMGHGGTGSNVQSTAAPNPNPVTLTEAVLIARGLFPSSEVRRITTPRGELGTYRINLRQKRELNQRHPFTTVWVDRWSGQIREVNNPTQFSAGQTFTTWLWPLHTGEAFDSRFIWFIVGLTPLILWLSGASYWLYRKGLLQDRDIDLPGLSKKACIQFLALGRRYGKSMIVLLQPRLSAALRIARISIKRWSERA